jgi:hypothetical protein
MTEPQPELLGIAEQNPAIEIINIAELLQHPAAPTHNVVRNCYFV